MSQVGPYRLDALVGRGTNGSVWRATRLGPVPHEVAVKRSRVGSASDTADAAERLRREAGILAELDHPHIVRVVDVLEDAEGLVIVMSLARGGSLHDLLDERDRLTPGQTVAVLARVADALGSAHRRGVLHGDVKPANILFTTDGEPLLGDFGVAQHLLPERTVEGGVSRHVVEGTTGYVDPELVVTGHHEPRNDVYGLGVVAYLCLTGRLPHAGATGREVLAAADAGDHPPLVSAPGVPAPLAAVVESALARDPADRPGTAEELADGLRRSIAADEARLPGTALRAGADLDPSVLLADLPSEPSEPSSESSESSVSSESSASPPAVVAVEAAAAGDVDDPDAARGTRAFGPRPPTAPAEGERDRPMVRLLAVVGVLALAVAAGLVLRDRLSQEQAPTDVSVAGGGPPDAMACEAPDPLPVPDGSDDLVGDLDGDGCPEQVVWDGQVMRFRLGDEEEPRLYDFRSVDGDRSPGQLLLGDWDCDGADSPALYRPSSGVVLYFPSVPDRVGGEVTADPDPTRVRDGEATVEPGDGGCDTVDVTPRA